MADSVKAAANEKNTPVSRKKDHSFRRIRTKKARKGGEHIQLVTRAKAHKIGKAAPLDCSYVRLWRQNVPEPCEEAATFRSRHSPLDEGAGHSAI
ncbi:hypothetical protein [Achromobacter xylosoxidans]|uniref:hypothetical protein n=1 Tax=Alcaligenes xylosoxydans xylosoxydans TaxID=85698 RepID=UPI0014022C93|nr:hypothetical protein [Achromobacter xylosoxidans]MBC9904857.1 hypothetical protein [Achromobacter xylosoxidans]MBD0868774.1 hypothetical protein [Achromobacter xylosoxidans]QNP87727.1 hypothetical protein IAG39_09555 [Achromobacter xylosoxidans]